MPKYLVSAGGNIRFKTFLMTAGDVVDMPDGLLATFSATNQARFSTSAAAATVTIPAYYQPADYEAPTVDPDPVKANAITMAAGEWTDCQTDGDGLALIGKAVTGSSLVLDLPNGVSGARYTGSELSGDFLISGDLGFSTNNDINVNPNVELILGVAPGGLDSDITNAPWYGVRISALAAQVGAIEVSYVKNNAVAGDAWTGTPSRTAFKAVFAVNQIRIAIKRVVDALTLSIVSPDGSELPVDTQALVSQADAQVFVRAYTGQVGTRAHLHRLAVNGLDMTTGLLVAS